MPVRVPPKWEGKGPPDARLHAVGSERGEIPRKSSMFSQSPSKMPQAPGRSARRPGQGRTDRRPAPDQSDKAFKRASSEDSTTGR